MKKILTILSFIFCVTASVAYSEESNFTVNVNVNSLGNYDLSNKTYVIVPYTDIKSYKSMHRLLRESAFNKCSKEVEKALELRGAKRLEYEQCEAADFVIVIEIKDLELKKKGNQEDLQTLSYYGYEPENTNNTQNPLFSSSVMVQPYNETNNYIGSARINKTQSKSIKKSSKYVLGRSVVITALTSYNKNDGIIDNNVLWKTVSTCLGNPICMTEHIFPYLLFAAGDKLGTSMEKGENMTISPSDELFKKWLLL